MLGACIGCILWLPLVQEAEQARTPVGREMAMGFRAAEAWREPTKLLPSADPEAPSEQQASRQTLSGDGGVSSPTEQSPSAGVASDGSEAGPGSQQSSIEPQEDVVVTARRRSKADPLEAINAESFKLTQKVDDAVTAPASRLYARVTPRPVRDGIRHFLNNLREPVAFANFLLQHKIGKAAETFARFAINSTLGIAGVVDVARRCPFRLPWRPNGFSDTLGFYGVGSGPFIFLPLAGPTTVRDLAGGIVDRLASPFAIGGPFRSKAYLVSTNVYRLLDRRAEQEDELRAVRESADPYVARRELYLKKREDRLSRLKGRSAVPESSAGAREVRPEPCSRHRAAAVHLDGADPGARPAGDVSEAADGAYDPPSRPSEADPSSRR